MKDLIRYFLLVRMRSFFRHAPLWAVNTVTFLVALLEFLYHRRARTIIADGLRRDLQLKGWKLHRVVLGTFYHHLLNDFEALRLPTVTKAYIERHIRLTGAGWDHIQKNPGKAAVLCTFHFGSNQMIIPTLPLLGYPLSQMGVPPTEWDKLAPSNSWTKASNRTLTEALEGTTTPFIYVSEGISSLRKIRQAILDGHILCVACDGRASNVESHPFLHGTTEINPGGIGIATRYEIPLILLFSRRTSFGYTMELHEPIHILPNQEQHAIQTCIALLERYVRAYPEQYGWMYYAKAVGG